jgi:predicted ATPase/DNA-binding NarL/FixJ family response regulator/Tfp pilus assembly protein PilF
VCNDGSQGPGEWIKALRERLGLTQTRLAALLDVSNVTVNRWERGRMRPGPVVWKRLQQIERDGAAASGTEPGRAGNLPLAATLFIGRERELATVRMLAAAKPVVTVTGPGGSGKTRLAIEACRGLAGRFPDGCWFVDLAAIPDPALVAPAVARVLGVREGVRQSVIERIAAVWADRRLLVILDNCEQVVAGCAAFAVTLRGMMPGLHVLATSRRPLDVPGEEVWAIPPLPPDDAVALFRDRARHRRPEASYDDGQAAAVAELCRRLDGLPLAIELAAARAHVLSPAQIADRLGRRFELLRADGGAPPRHRALAAAIAWSYDLLTPEEKTLFRRLGVFAGRFTPEAVEAICGQRSAVDGELASGETLASPVPDLIERLVRQSMVLAEEDETGALRYRLLESLAEFARDRLSEDAARALAARHAGYYGDLATEAAGRRRGARGADWAAVLDREQANVVAALEWAIDAAPYLAVRLAVALWPYWRRRARFVEGTRLLDRTLAACGEMATAEVIDVLIGAAIFHGRLGEHDTATRLAAEAAARARAIDRGTALANAIAAVGLAAEERGDLDAAEESYREAEALAAHGGDRLARAVALNGLGRIATNRGDLEAAEAYFAEAWSLTQAVGDLDAETGVLLNLAEVAARAGRTAVAAGHYERVLPLIRTLGDPNLYATAVANLAELRLSRGDTARAVDLASEAVETFRASGHRAHLANTLYVVGVALDAAGRPRDGLDRLREALETYHRLGATVDAAQTMEAMAGLLVRLGMADQAARSLGAAAAIRESAGVDPYPLLDYAGTVAAVRTALGQTAFDEAWATGRALTANRAIVELLHVEIPSDRDLEGAPPATPPARVPALTPRQAEILRLVADGHSNREIASMLGISERTVERHLTAIFTAIGVDRRSAAVAVALGAGLLGDPRR